jgi:hypothetical protein
VIALLQLNDLNRIALFSFLLFGVFFAAAYRRYFSAYAALARVFKFTTVPLYGTAVLLFGAGFAYPALINDWSSLSLSEDAGFYATLLMFAWGLVMLLQLVIAPFDWRDKERALSAELADEEKHSLKDRSPMWDDRRIRWESKRIDKRLQTSALRLAYADEELLRKGDFLSEDISQFTVLFPPRAEDPAGVLIHVVAPRVGSNPQAFSHAFAKFMVDAATCVFEASPEIQLIRLHFWMKEPGSKGPFGDFWGVVRLQRSQLEELQRALTGPAAHYFATLKGATAPNSHFEPPLYAVLQLAGALP